MFALFSENLRIIVNNFTDDGVFVCLVHTKHRGQGHRQNHITMFDELCGPESGSFGKLIDAAIAFDTDRVAPVLKLNHLI